MSKVSTSCRSVKRTKKETIVPGGLPIPAPVPLPSSAMPYYQPSFRSLGDLARSGYDFSVEGMIDRMGY